MTKRIFSAILRVAGVVLLASAVLIMGCLYGYFGGVQKQQLEDELTLAAAAVEQDGKAYLQSVNADRCRLTWIATDGTVLYDTKTDSESLENHASRAEVQQALATGTGSSTRYSATLLEKTMYEAKRLSDGTVLRVSVSRGTVGVLALGILQPVIIVLLAALVLSELLARRLAARIVEPLNNLDLEHPLDNDCYAEISPLLRRIDRQHAQIDRQLQQLRRETQEFAQITGNLREGLVLLDASGCVLSINPAARQLFGVADDCLGRDFLTIDRTPELTAAIHSAQEAGHSEIRVERSGSIWQFDVSRIGTEDAPSGVVILAFDVTEQMCAEQSRREFTANVSHELKTPLQGIIGSAELIENGMVQPEDLPRFVGHIRKEAQRLVTLIGDIIRLSQLDEGVALPRERVDLQSVAREVKTDLAGAAEKQNVTIELTGEAAPMQGVRRLLYEIVYNLCDNAIRYNVDGGRVTLHTFTDGDAACVTVRDTGIGIPQEAQGRVFERFYRVDKSHSKASGGTGLGLSIVKHAVQYHGGRTSLESQPGKGTQITVRFPAEAK